ncbi:gamma-aminobutyric acid type B receptor subunit 2-like isoform X2 [Brevipalpus obovatus]|uniref:gamma-aminobutyric acid type B receptor subunit 2-like isoform X2 n=1 Tax=Brevipalpus obovatus TaxID=246614 RepID=UPI003D9E8B85
MGSSCTDICLFLLTIAIIILTILQNAQCKRTNLHVAGFFPFKDSIPEGQIGLGVWPAVELALQHINSNPNILTNYNLSIVPADTECDPAVGMKCFFDMIHNAPKKLMLFGDACYTVTDPIAKASRFFNLIQLTYADTHPMFTGKTYQNFYRVVPSDFAFNPARIALLQRFNWTKVGYIYEKGGRYELIKLANELEKVSIQIKYAQGIKEDFEIVKVFEKLKSEGIRIILGSFGEEFARKIFCEAYKHDIFGRKYQWIIAGQFQEDWWNVVDTSMGCEQEQLLRAMDGYISTETLELSSSSQVTASGLIAAQYKAEYDRVRRNHYSKYHGYAYDGVWTIAFALHNTAIQLLSEQSNITIDKFDYRDQYLTNLTERFRTALDRTSFIGVTGNVSFKENERRGSIMLKQFQNSREVKIGEYHSTSDILDLEAGDEPISWRGSPGPPADEVIKTIAPTRISLTLFIVISIFAVMGIILALIFLSMNIKYRKQRYIKMSSPYLNNLIIIGCMLTYTSVILLGLDSRLLSEANFPYICAARAWVLMSGFTLAFGAMFSKTWRVHAIFTNIKLNKKVIKDYKLFMVVGILVFIDVATLTTWQIVDPFYRGTHQGNPKPSPENEDQEIIPLMEFCDSKRMTIFLGSIYVYKGLLMAFGCFLAWETRHVSIPALNDSKYIGMSVYNVVIMCVIGAGLSFVLKEQQDAAFVIISIFIIFCSTATLCLVFVPKLIELKRNPNMDERRVRPTLKPLKKSRKESDEMELHQRIKVLTEFNTRQKQRLKEKTFELEALMFRLRQYGIEMGAQNHEVKISATSCLMTAKTHYNPTAKKFPSDKQIWLLLTEKESSMTKSEKDTSFLSLSASPSFFSSNDDSGSSVPKKSHTSCPELGKSDESSTESIMRHRKDPQIAENCASPKLKGMLKKVPSKTSSNSSSDHTLTGKLANDFEGEKIDQSKDPIYHHHRTESEIIKTKVPRTLSSITNDETSYSLAIKASLHDQALNGLYSSCEEDDTERCDQTATISEAESDQSLKLPPTEPSNETNRRRAQSLSALQINSQSTSSSTANLPLWSRGGCISMSGREVNSIKAIFPLFSTVDKSDLNKPTVHFPTFRSHSSVKCDIVEYV